MRSMINQALRAHPPDTMIERVRDENRSFPIHRHAKRIVQTGLPGGSSVPRKFGRTGPDQPADAMPAAIIRSQEMTIRIRYKRSHDADRMRCRRDERDLVNHHRPETDTPLHLLPRSQ